MYVAARGQRTAQIPSTIETAVRYESAAENQVHRHEGERGGVRGAGGAGGPVKSFYAWFSLDERCPIQAVAFAAWVGKHDRSISFNRTPSGNWLPRQNAVPSDSISTVPLTPVA